MSRKRNFHRYQVPFGGAVLQSLLLAMVMSYQVQLWASVCVFIHRYFQYKNFQVLAVACSISGILAFALPIPIIINRFQVEQECVLSRRSVAEENTNENP